MKVKEKSVCKTEKKIYLEEEMYMMIHTGEYKVFGQMEDQANGVVDIEAFVFRNGEIVPANGAETFDGPVIHTAEEKNYGQLEEQAAGNVDVEAFVFRNGEIIPENQADTSAGPVVRTPADKNFAK